ncbi:hypothetical protein FRC17_010479 [Serendipita sp. 399]|nr:hypothetical protein FRC17_010479 [Serendipita sp. 399]
MELNKIKVAIITGASSGIGRVTARALACKAGWRVVLSARREIELQETAMLCRKDYATALNRSDGVVGDSVSLDSSSATEDHESVPKDLTLVVPGDVTKEEDVKRLFEATVAEYGITGPTCPLEQLPLADFEAVIKINLVAAVLCTQQAIKCFKTQRPPGGRIINNGSLAAHVPRPHAAAYAISKHAILGLTRSTQLEGRTFGITCTQIDIGNAMTQMAHGTATSGALQPDGSTRVEGAIDARHVANVVVHIAGLPLDVTVLEMNIMATNMPYVGRG